MNSFYRAKAREPEKPNRRSPLKNRSAGVFYLYFVFFLSGLAGLGYEIVWVRMFAVGFGHEFVSLLAVLTAFFGGLALGAWALDGPVSRSRRPGRWYANLELLIGLWGLVTIVIIPWVNQGAALLIGTQPSPLRHWAVAFFVPLVVLFPATASMGGTLPAMDRFFSRLRADGRSVGSLYGANTLGAVTGTLGTIFVLVPHLGMRITLLVLATFNFACAVAVLVKLTRGEETRGSVQAAIRDLPGSVRLGVTVFLTGLLGIGYEVLAVRVMSQILENTVYSFATALSTYLLATSLGAVAYQAYGRRQGFRELLTHLGQAISTSCLLGILVLSKAAEVYGSLRNLFGGGFRGSIAAETGLALAVFFLPSFFMGALFSHLAQGARQKSGGVGKALGLNMLGSALAPVAFGVLLLPTLGAKLALLTVALSYLVLAPLVPLRRLVPAAVPLLLIPALPVNLNLVKALPGGEILAYRQGVIAAVSVVTDSRGFRYLKVNNRFHMGSTVGAFGERRLAHIPLLLHPDPRRALFLGLGTGITFGAARSHPKLAVEGVELVPEILDVLPFFRAHNGDLLRRAGPALRVADARRYVRASRSKYDVIVADLFHPARDGSGALYTLEHFLAVRERLAPGGLFCQWLPLYQLDVERFRIIARTFLEVFPDSRAFLAYFNVVTPAIALVGTREPVAYPADWYKQRVRSPQLSQALIQSGLADELALFGTFIANREGLAAFTHLAPLNTDDRPLVAFGAPHFAYRDPPPTWTLLELLLDTFRPEAQSVLAIDESYDDHIFARRLDNYLSARNFYLRAEILQAQGQHQEAVEVYLESVGASPDFLTGYARLLRVAQEQATADPDGARRLLLALKNANPYRPEAKALLKLLSP